MNISIRNAQEEDKDIILKWRNDLASRLASNNESVVSTKEHDAWFQKALKDEDKFLYIGILNNEEKIGICKFEINDDYAECSINLAPEFRGKKISIPFLSQCIERFFLNQNKTKTIYAYIKKYNVPSLECFRNSGFIYSHEKSSPIRGTDLFIFMGE